jgi:hypothetical protein
MITNEPLDARYLYWLYDQISVVENTNPAESYGYLIEHAFRTEFYWSVPNDDNRIADGVDLRSEFLEHIGAERDANFMEIECSMLEVLVALCRHLSLNSDFDSYFWFKKILDNLAIGHITDDIYGSRLDSTDVVDMVWHDVIYRDYRPNGQGGLFPLKRPKKDQRNVEIWYQMSAYLLENKYS